MWKMQEHFPIKESIQSLGDTDAECRLLPATRCFYRGLPERTSLSFLAKCGIHAAPWAIPDKTASARRSITGLGGLFKPLFL
jgi:hypothetical protein